MPGPFTYPYLMLNVTATLEGALTIKQGLRTFTAPVEAITGFTVIAQKAGAQSVEELIVSYTRPDSPKPGIIRTYANLGHPAFAALVAELAKARPGADLRGLPKKEALAKLGAVDVQKVALVAIPLLVLLVFAGLMGPKLVHGLDKGHAEVTAEALALGKLPETRNLTLSGELESKAFLEVTHTKNGAKTSSEYFFAVVPEDAGDDATVPVVLETGELTESGVEALARAPSWPCTLRNVGWEGLSGSNRDYFHDTLKLAVTKDTLLCELDTGGPGDLFFFGLVMGLAVLVLIPVMFVVWRQGR